MTTAPHLALENVGRRWGARVALDDVSLELEPGSLVAIAGPSGSGKSTMLRLLMGELQASGGRVLVDGQDISKVGARALRRHRTQCGILQQDSHVIDQLNVHRNVLAGRVPQWPWYRVAASALWPIERELVHGLLGRVGLQERQWDRAGELSGGQKQRVALARSLAGTPRVILADEPTSALDPTTGAEVIELIVSEARRCGATLIVSSHRLSQLLDDVDRVIGLREGKVCLDCTPADVINGALDDLYEGSRERA